MLKKLISQSEKVAKCNFKSKVQLHEQLFFQWMNSFLQCRRQIFTCWAFLQKKSHLELNCTKHFFRASKNNNSVFSATKQIMRNASGTKCSKASFSVRKVAKCNFTSKVQLHEQLFFLIKWTVFCLQKTDFHLFELFCQKSHSLELNCTKHLFGASKNTNSVFRAKLSSYENARPQMLKSFFLSQKK